MNNYKYYMRTFKNHPLIKRIKWALDSAILNIYLYILILFSLLILIDYIYPSEIGTNFTYYFELFTLFITSTPVKIYKPTIFTHIKFYPVTFYPVDFYLFIGFLYVLMLNILILLFCFIIYTICCYYLQKKDNYL